MAGRPPRETSLPQVRITRVQPPRLACSTGATREFNRGDLRVQPGRLACSTGATRVFNRGDLRVQPGRLARSAGVTRVFGWRSSRVQPGRLASSAGATREFSSRLSLPLPAPAPRPSLPRRLRFRLPACPSLSPLRLLPSGFPSRGGPRRTGRSPGWLTGWQTGFFGKGRSACHPVDLPPGYHTASRGPAVAASPSEDFLGPLTRCDRASPGRRDGRHTSGVLWACARPCPASPGPRPGARQARQLKYHSNAAPEDRVAR
jgi:hypothetical protein